MARSDAQHRYAIRGGMEGKKRLDLLARVMLPTTVQLLDRVGSGRGDEVPGRRLWRRPRGGVDRWHCRT
jgi:hypothetical protein